LGGHIYDLKNLLLKTFLPTNSKFKLIFLAIILLFLLLAAGVWVYYQLKIKQIEKDYSAKPTAKELLETNKPFSLQLQNGIYL
jgi:hypothetical protein